MEQRFIDGDNLSFKEYFLIWKDLVRFRKLGKWFIFCSLKTIVIFVPLFLFMTLAGLLAGTLPKDITEILRFFSYIISGGLIVVWCISFFHSFIFPSIIKRRVSGFVKRYIPEAGDLTQFDTDVWFFTRKNHWFSIAYKENVTRVIIKNRYRKKTSRYYKISPASSYGDYLDWDIEAKERPLMDGITLVTTNVTVFARIKFRKKFFPNEIENALDALLK
jgi:hypothetical protein